MRKKIILFIVLAFPSLLLFTGCSGGVNGDGGNTYSQTVGTPVIRADSFNDVGWSLIEKGQYESAIAKFNAVLSDNPNEDEMVEANNGLGWARSKLGSLHDGIEYFKKAAYASADAKVGLAAALIQQASKSDLEQVVDILYKQLGNENPHFHYVPRRPTGVSDAECHAMLAFAFAGVGRREDAILQMDFAKELNPDWASSTIDQIDKVVNFLDR